jgi:Arc/MetJ-type ribon-helix-helix transcriptional regulator
MLTDAIRAALSATQEAWAEADERYPSDDPDLKAALLSELDAALSALDQALSMAGVPDDA